MYSTYQNINSDFTNATSANIVYNNAGLQAVNLGTAINTRNPIISVVDNSKELISGRQGISISKENVKFVSSAKVVPKHFNITNVETNIQFQGVTTGWVKPKSMYAQFTTSLQGRTARLDQTYNDLDTFKASKCIQAPFCFLNELIDYDGGFASDTRGLYIDKTLSQNILAAKAIMCLKPRTADQHLSLKSLGLPCAKTNIWQDFEDPFIANAYDSLFIDLLAANKSTKDTDEEYNLMFNNYEYKFNVFLAELFPFLDSDEWIPPNTPFFFNFKFSNNKSVQQGVSNSGRFNSYNNYFTKSQTSTVSTESCLVNRPNANVMYYDYYSLYPELEKMYSILPPVIRNAWGYKIHEINMPNSFKRGNTYQFTLNNVQIPTSIIFYVETNTQFAIIQADPTIANQKYSEKNSFLCGLNYDSFKISSGSQTFVYAENLNVNNTFQTIDKAGTVTTSFNNNESLYNHLFNLNQQKQINDLEYVACSTKFNQQDSVIPIKFVLRQQETQSPDQRSLPIGSSTIEFSFSLKGTYYYYDSTSNLTEPPVAITDSLPPNTRVVLIAQYPMQIIHDTDNVFSSVAPPYIAYSVDQMRQVQDVNTN